MATPFPNEQPISTHDTIELTENGIFSEFEDELQSTTIGSGQTKRDYEFRQAGANGRIILAKPIKSGNLWACDITSGSPNQNVWVEKAQYDPATGGVDDSQSPQGQQQAVPPGTCPSCGQTGVNGKFCNSCGGPLAAPAPMGAANPLAGLPLVPGPVPVPMPGPLAPGQTPSAGAGAQATPVHVNPDRMTGRPKKEVVVPEGMTKVTKSTGFADELDKLLADAEAGQTAEAK
jgi:hypothetical protein